LLASGAPIPPAAAEKPYFYYARVKAAGQANNNDVRLRLLRAALEINPDAAPPRLPLFRAAVALGRESLALAAISERMETWGEGTQRARLLREMGEAYRKLERPQEAKMFFEQAQRLDPSVPVRKQLDAIAADAKRTAANALRRPDIAVRLEQDRIVRPRL
jgi:tetratricopeptide (TPR) repeat protein